jgi:2'-5' RNA ligase
MNTRLQNQYTTIEEHNKAKFLRNEIEIDAMWGQPIWGVTLQIDLGEKVKDVLCQYQDELAELEPDNLLLLPRQYQHLSFNQVVFWGGDYELSRTETWESVSGEFLNAFKKQHMVHQSFKVTFSKLVATTGGIIWCSFDKNDELEKLREMFLERLPFPKETTKFNHIIHTTVARYKNKLSNPARVLDYLESKTEAVEMSVQGITLLNELMFPSIKTISLAEVSLKETA